MKQRKTLRRLCLYALFAAILCVLSPIAIPIGPVPVSFSVMGILLCCAVLGARAVIPVSVYLAVGALGLPVFAGGMGGLGVLVGPTGGFLWSYLLLAALTGLFYRSAFRDPKPRRMRFFHTFLLALPGMGLCYLCGTLQYMLVASTTLMQAIWICVLPFLLFDFAKIFLIGLLADRLLAIPSVRATVTAL